MITNFVTVLCGVSKALNTLLVLITISGTFCVLLYFFDVCYASSQKPVFLQTILPGFSTLESEKLKVFFDSCLTTPFLGDWKSGISVVCGPHDFKFWQMVGLASGLI